MNLAYNYQPIPNCSKKAEMEAFLQGTYWENDIWLIEDPFFENYRPQNKKNYPSTVDFTEFPELMRLEYKYYFAIRITSQTLQISVIFANFKYKMRIFSQFLRDNYPELCSFAEIQIEEMIPHWIEYTEHSGKRHPPQFRQPYLFFSKFYDTRDEYEKDIWDCRKIPGIRFLPNSEKNHINFTKVPPVFRRLAQRYIKLRITIISIGRSRIEVEAISLFLQFIAIEEPEWEDLKALTRRHIESFLSFHFNTVGVKTRRCIDKLAHVKTFLERIQQFDYPEAPVTPVPSLMYFEDIPRAPIPSPMEERIKHIPEGVMAQLNDYLEFLGSADYIPIIILLIASGWRGSDVLNLKYDTCLEYTTQGWYLCGDIPKTNVIRHRIPITDEVRIVVESVIEVAKSKSTPLNNPMRLLFNRYNGIRIGKSPTNSSIIRALDSVYTRL